MSGGTMRVAAAEQSQLDTRALEALRGNLVTQLNGIRTQLDTMRRSGMPAMVTYTDANMRSLLETVATNAAALGLPITGTTPEERFRSLNNWLNSAWRDRPALAGRNQDSPIDQASLDELRTRLTIALSAPGATAVATAVAPAVSGAPVAAPPVQPPAPVVPVPVPSGPVAAPAQPAAPVAAPAVAEAVPLRVQHSVVLNDLEDIATYGRTRQIRDRATSLMRDLNREFDARRPSTSTIERKLRDARTLIESEHATAIQNQTEERRRAYETAVGQPHPLAADITALASNPAVSAGLAAVPVPAGGRAVRVSDIWLLDDTSIRQMVAHLQAGRYSEAVQLFNTQQAAYLRLVETARGVAQAEVTEIHGSSLPTQEQLQARERQDGVPAGTYYNLRYPREGRLQRRIPTARSDLEAVAQRRLDAATAMAGQRGRLAYFAVESLYNDTAMDVRMLHNMVGLWDYASSGLSSYSDASTVYTNYAQSVALFVAPEVNPFSLYTRDQQDALIRAYLNLPAGTMPTSQQEARARRELSEQLLSNRPLRYDYTLYQFFDQVMKMNQPSGVPGVARLAAVRSLRLAAEMEYQPYLLGTPPVLRDDQGRLLMNASGQMMSQDELDALTPEVPHRRFVFARGMLERAIQTAQESGMPADDAVLVAARAWLASARTEPTVDAQRVTVADNMYYMTLDLLSIRQAELWVANPTLRASASSATTTAAQEQLRRARAAFIWSFSTPQVGTAYHASMARRLADDATNMLMVPGFGQTEAQGMYFTRAYYSGRDIAQPAGAGENWTPALSDLITNAQVGERLYLTFLATLAQGPRATLFSPSPADTVPEQAGLAGASRGLSFMVGRQMPLATAPNAPLGGFPVISPVVRRVRPTVSVLDSHQLPGVVAANPSLGSLNHEDADQYVNGQAYVEIFRQLLMSADPSVDPLLRGFDVAPDRMAVRTDANFRQQDQALKDRLIAIAREYGLPTDRPLYESLRERMLSASAAYSQALATADDATRTRLLGERLQEANRLMMAVLDVRIAQLESRLNGNVILTDGQPIRVSDLARSADPRRYAVVRAQEMLAEARALRARFAGAPGTDYFGRGGADPREAIGIAEMGLASLTDAEITPIPRPVAPQIAAAVPLDAITQDRSTRVSDRDVRETIVTFTATRTMITPRGGSPVTLEEYERANGRQNLTYYWFMFQDIQPATGMLLLNPAYRDPAQLRYVGMIMRGARTTDGRTGDFVVRVRRLDAPSRDLEWAAVQEADGRIRPENVLFEMRSGTMDPVRDARLEASLMSSAFLRGSNQMTVVNYGPTTPCVIVKPEATNAPQPAAPAAAPSQKKK